MPTSKPMNRTKINSSPIKIFSTITFIIIIITTIVPKTIHNQIWHHWFAFGRCWFWTLSFWLGVEDYQMETGGSCFQDFSVVAHLQWSVVVCFQSSFALALSQCLHKAVSWIAVLKIGENFGCSYFRSACFCEHSLLPRFSVVSALWNGTSFCSGSMFSNCDV